MFEGLEGPALKPGGGLLGGGGGCRQGSSVVVVAWEARRWRGCWISLGTEGLRCWQASYGLVVCYRRRHLVEVGGGWLEAAPDRSSGDRGCNGEKEEGRKRKKESERETDSD
ncbi:hypothetical protein Droror1_Dr00020452 [Drosera rotundifolia]